MNKKAMIEEVCQYVLDQQHERYDLIGRLADNAKDWHKDGMTKKAVKDMLISQRENSIFYIAMYLAHGRRLAAQSYRSCVAEAMEKL